MDIELIKQLYTSGLSTYQIGKQLNLNPDVIWRSLKKNGVKIRSKKEALEKYAKYDNCIICGNKFRVRENWKYGNHYRKTCSSDCEKKYRSKRIKETYTEERKQLMSEKLKGREITWEIKRGDSCSNWKGGKAPNTYRRIAFNEFELEMVCSKCGTEENLCVHHIDENRNNNSKENLLVVCRGCHTSLHAKNNKLWVKHMNK